MRLEQYALIIGVEAKLALEIGLTVILPAAIRYQTELAQSVVALIAALRSGLSALKAALGCHVEGSFAEALHARDEVLPAMALVRSAADALEDIVADDLWPLPTYQEMLYIL